MTNRITGTVQTVDAVSGTVLTFVVPNTAGVYNLEIIIAAFDSANAQGASYDISGTVKCDGAGALATLGSPVRIIDGDPAFIGNLVTVSISGLTISIFATGLAGRTIRWTGLMTYVFGGA